MVRSQPGQKEADTMLEIAVCEDEQADRDRLCSMLGVILDKQNIECRITCYGSGEELLEADAVFQLVFLDIMMDGKNGIDVGREICRKNRKACIIYQTNFGEYITEAVNTVHAFAYLSKPVTEEELEQQVTEYLVSVRKEERRLGFRNVSYEENGIETVKPSLSLPMEKILYFEYIKAKKRIRIVTEDVCYEYPGIFSVLEGELRKEGFETSCRGILVNLRNVAKIRGYEVVLKNGGSVPLSQKRVTEFKVRLNKELFKDQY